MVSWFQYDDRAIPTQKHVEVMVNKFGIAAAPITPQMFGNAGKEHMEKYGNNQFCLTFRLSRLIASDYEVIN